MAQSANKLPPFTPVDLRAWIEGTSGERDIVGAIRLIQWLEAPDEPIYLAQIVAACFPTSERQVKRDLASAKARGWVLAGRKAKGRLGRSAPTYILAIDPLGFSMARAILEQRANLAHRSEEPTGQLLLTKGPETTDQGATQAPANIKEKDLRESLKRKTTPPKAADVGRHPEQGVFWAEAAAIWTAKFPGQRLLWPGAKDPVSGVVLSPPIRDFQKLLTGHLTALASAELLRRWSHCVNDPFSRPSLRALVLDVDRWINPRTSGPGNGSRSAVPPSNPDKWSPSAHQPPRA